MAMWVSPAGMEVLEETNDRDLPAELPDTVEEVLEALELRLQPGIPHELMGQVEVVAVPTAHLERRVDRVSRVFA